MKKWIIPIIVVLLIVVFIIFKPKITSLYKLELEANATTGYSWSYSVDKEGIVEFVKDEYISNETNELVGVGGKQIYEIKGLKKGKVVIKFEYKRSWEENIDPIETKTITLMVDKNLNVKEK